MMPRYAELLLITALILAPVLTPTALQPPIDRSTGRTFDTPAPKPPENRKAVDQRRQLLETWPRQQARARDRVQFLTVRRATEHRFDLPHRGVHTRSASEVYGTLSPSLREAYPVETELDGRSADREQLESLWNRENPLFRRYREMITRIRPLPPRMMDDLAPLPERRGVSESRGDTLTRTASRQFRFRPREYPTDLQRVTLWFAPDSPRLTRSQTLYQFENETSFRITARYRRIDGLDVAHTVEAEGVFFERRRLRVFTSLIRSRVTYEHYRTTRRPEDARVETD